MLHGPTDCGSSSGRALRNLTACRKEYPLRAVSAEISTTIGWMRVNFTGSFEPENRSIAALRTTVQAFPVVPTLKAVIAHYRQDPGWAEVRPPFVPLPKAEAERAIATLADKHGFRLHFAEAA